MTPAPTPPPGVITWIKVDKPFFDLWGVFVSSVTFTGAVLVLAVVCGIVLGLLLPSLRRANRIDPALELGILRGPDPQEP